MTGALEKRSELERLQPAATSVISSATKRRLPADTEGLLKVVLLAQNDVDDMELHCVLARHETFERNRKTEAVTVPFTGELRQLDVLERQVQRDRSFRRGSGDVDLHADVRSTDVGESGIAKLDEVPEVA